MATRASKLFMEHVESYNRQKNCNILEKISHRLLDDADAGDMAAVKLVYQHAIPPVKAMTPSSSIQLPALPPVGQLDFLFRGLADGKFTSEEVLPLIDMLKAHIDASQLEIVKRNLESLERNLGIPDKYKSMIYG